MAEVGGEAFARGGKAFDGFKGTLCKGQPAKLQRHSSTVLYRISSFNWVSR